MIARGRQLLGRIREARAYERQPRLPRRTAIVSMTLADGVFWLAVMLSYLTITLPIFRYLAFSIPFLVLLTVLGDRKVRFDDELHPFALLLVWGAALGALANVSGWKDLFFIFSGVSIALLAKVPTVSSTRALMLTFLCMCIYYPLFGKNLQGGISFDVATSDSSFESNFSFLLGLIAVVALLEKRMLVFVLAALLTLVTLKRIAVLGVLVVLIAYMLEKRRPGLFVNPFTMVLVNTLFLGISLGYGLGYFDYVIYQVTGESANQLGMGRRGALELPAKLIMANPLQSFFTGTGPGGVYDLMNPRGGSGRVGNLHSDLIKLVYEYGFLFTMIFVMLGYRAKTMARRLVFLYFNVLLLTDNVLIYYFFLFFMMVYPRAAIEQEMEQAADNNQRSTRGENWQAHRAGSG